MSPCFRFQKKPSAAQHFLVFFRFVFTSVFFAGMLVFSASASELQPIPSLDLKLYAGEWYEVARKPNSFQKNCGATKVKYELDNDKMKVLNICRKKNADGEFSTANGIARVADKKINSKLKVSFVPLLKHLGLFAGNYWVLALDEDYQWALVGEPRRRYLWLLSRKPRIQSLDFVEISSKADLMGYDTSDFTQSPPWTPEIQARYEASH